MAIDTAAKRYSAIHVGASWRGPAALPDGSISGDARLALLHLYGGIAAEAPVEVPDVVGLTQADAILAIEAAGFVVSVTTAASNAVATGLVIGQVPAGGEFAAAGSTVAIVVSTGDSGILDAKFQGYPNVRVRGLAREEDEYRPPLPAQITNMPDGPPVPPPEAGMLARGLDLGLLPDEVVQPLPLVEIEPPVVTVKPRAPEPRVEEPAPVSEQPLTVVVEEPAPEPAPPPTEAEQVRAALAPQIDALRVELSAAKVQVTRAFDEIAALRAQIKRDRDLAALNRKRAAEITRKLMNKD